VSTLLDHLRNAVLVADGALGSQIHLLADAGFSLPDEVTTRQPEVVLQVHTAYLRAGARLIETNTWGANTFKLDRIGLGSELAKLNQRAVKIAREAREIVGVDAYIAGAMGPSGLRIDPSIELERRLASAFQAQAAVLDDRGVDAIILETFASPWELAIAASAVRKATALPILAQLTLPASDDWSDPDAVPDGEAERFAGLLAVDADVFGLNCTLGPGQILPVLRRLAAAAPGRFLSVQPNSGLPQRADGRFVYPETSAAYYAQFARDAVEAGAHVIGGCCGTTPEQIGAIASAVAALRPGGVAETTAASPLEVAHPSVQAGEAPAARSGLAERLARGEFVVSMQVDPPKGTEWGMILEAVRAFRDSGHVHVVDVNSNPMARLHMDALWLSAAIEREGMETIAHYTPRDASLMGIQGNLLGAWNAGVRNVLVITGDPSVVNGEPGGHDVYQTDGIGMLGHLSALNRGVDTFGHTIGSPPNFFLGCAVNPNHEDLAHEVERFKKKVAQGAQFAMTQVFFDWSCWDRFLEALGEPCPIPVLAAIWPLTSHALALRLDNEVPGIVVPPHVLQRLSDAGPHARREGFALARELLAEARTRVQGVYIIAPFKRPMAALELFEAPKSDG
jgi:homocysteine S-methyltransferase